MTNSPSLTDLSHVLLVPDAESMPYAWWRRLEVCEHSKGLGCTLCVQLECGRRVSWLQKTG
jgi:hypothetical protein